MSRYVENDSVWIQYGILSICLTNVLDIYVPLIFPSSLKGHNGRYFVIENKCFFNNTDIASHIKIHIKVVGH